MNLRDGSAVTGRITDADDAGVQLDVDGAERRLAYDEIGKAVVQVEFNRPPADDETAAEQEEDDEDLVEPDEDEEEV